MGLGIKLDFNSRRAGIPSAYYKGISYNANPGTFTTIDGSLDQPMLAVLNYCFTVGDLTVGATAVPNAASMAGFEYYNKVRSANASLGSYTTSDIFKITVAIAELYALHAELVRDFKLNFKIDFENLAFNTLTNAWIGYTTFNNDLSNIATRLNKAANDLRKFPVLKGIPAFDDLMYVSSNLFADDQINKAGTIAFAKDYILHYITNASSPIVGSLKYETLYAQPFTTKLSILETYISEYNADQDVSHVCSEILKAEGLYFYPVPTLDENNLSDCAKDLHRVFDWEIYDRIQNATIYPIKTNFATTTIAGIQEDSNGILVYGIDTVTNRGTGAMQAANYDGTGTNSNQLFRPDETNSWIFSHTEDPSEDAVVQFVAHHEHISSANSASNRYFTGLSILHINRGSIYYMNSRAGNNITRLDYTTLPHSTSDFVIDLNSYTDKASATETLMHRVQLYNSFGCLPNIWLVTYDSQSSYSVYVFPNIRDIDNFANISDATLVNIKALYTRGAFFLTPDNQNSKQAGRWKGGKGKKDFPKDKK